MSNHLAIATVTAVLHEVLSTSVKDDVTGTEVSILPPDDTGLNNNKPRLNIFLYKVTPNSAFRSVDLPTRRSDGSLVKKPQLGLDLSYLLTVYGSSAQTDPETHRVLGSAMRTLHSRPVLSRNTITKMINSLPSGNHLANTNLAEQIELVKFTPVSLNLEELSKLWSVFFQTPYRLSVAYQASVVLIDGKENPSPSLPVDKDKWNVFVAPFQCPQIESISPIFATEGDSLVIRGQNLKGKLVTVAFGSIIVPPAQDKIKNKKIEVSLPGNLKAGVNTVIIIHELDLNAPTGLHKIVESNMAAFMLRPDITLSPPTIVSGTTHKSGNIEVKFKPKIEKSQQVFLLLNQLNPPANQVPLAYQINAPFQNGIVHPSVNTDKILFEFKDIAAGDYLVRVRVDGAESELKTDPVSGKYIMPKVTI